MMSLIRKIYKKASSKRQERVFLRDLSRNTSLKQTIESNVVFKDLHKGERCFILGNGPSLKNQDLNCLQGEIIFTVNQFARSEYSKTLHPSYHLWADPAFFVEEASMNKDICELMIGLGGDTVTFFEASGYNFVKKHGIDRAIKCSFFKAGLSVFEKVSTDFTGLVSNVATIVQYAVELAVFMGFKEIYLLGCDMTGIISVIRAKEKKSLEGVYSYSIDDQEKKRIETVADNVSMESQFFGWGRMFSGYRILKEYCDKKNIVLVNATLGGVLDNLPRVELKSLFSKQG